MPVDPTDVTKPANTDPIGSPDNGIQVEMRAIKAYIATQVARIAALETGLLEVEPIGSFKMWPSVTAPDNWHFCDGAELDRGDYADLFTLIGTVFGDGDGINTFKLPDLRGRAPIGAGTAPGLTARALGDAAGTEETELLEENIPEHAHFAFQDGAGAAGPVTNVTRNARAVDYSGNNSYVIGIPPGGANDVGLTSTYGGDSGDTTPISNVQPVLTVNFIIKLLSGA